MAHLPVLIKDLALILFAAGVVTLLFRKMKQPLVLGYILAGVLVGPATSLFPTITDIENIKIWAEIGVIFLLFGLGLEFSFKKLFRVGGSALITALIEITSMLLLGFFCGKLLGWSNTDSFFLAGILSIASTTIIIRAFDELGVKNQKFTQNVFGVLVIEDLVAVVLLVALTTISIGRQVEGLEMVSSVIQLGFFLILWFLAGIFLIPTFLKKVKSLMSEETLMIVSLGLCLMMVMVASGAGFSPALGAFIMGSILAETTEAEKILRSTESIKNFFGAVFFVSVGMLIEPKMIIHHWNPVLVITLVLLAGKVVSVVTGSLVAGQSLKPSIQTGMSLAQIGEFSFIIASLGLTLGVTSDFLYPITVAVSAITTFTTPYMVRFSEPTFQWVSKKMPPTWKEQLESYSVGAQTISAADDWKLLLRSYTWRVIGNSVIVIAIFLLSINFLHPFFIAQISRLFHASVLTVMTALLFAAPFLWALAVAKSHRKSFEVLWKQKKYRGQIIVLELSRIYIAILLVTFLLIQFSSSSWAVVTPLLAISAGMILFRHRLQKVYHLLENKFLANLRSREEQDAQSSPVLAPWDAHIAHFHITPNLACIGKTLAELSVRENYGVTIALIQRGQERITAPGRDVQLFPHDRVAVIGNDEQLDKFKQLVTPPVFSASDEIEVSDYSLHKVILPRSSPYIAKSIRESGLREATQGLVVGIERKGQRILNPDSNIQFEPDDLIWIVGDAKRIRKLGTA
ncbi:MAG: cation:proton antiporter [Bdellovibrionales bacterium]